NKDCCRLQGCCLIRTELRSGKEGVAPSRIQILYRLREVRAVVWPAAEHQEGLFPECGVLATFLIPGLAQITPALFCVDPAQKEKDPLAVHFRTPPSWFPGRRAGCGRQKIGDDRYTTISDRESDVLSFFCRQCLERFGVSQEPGLVECGNGGLKAA